MWIYALHKAYGAYPTHQPKVDFRPKGSRTFLPDPTQRLDPYHRVRPNPKPDCLATDQTLLRNTPVKLSVRPFDYAAMDCPLGSA
ncbi:hypothetical protein IGI04_040160 [Brassica rapa subsp. trilocularis]|uniref:Neprosin domain-containing protein n=1 Tax=Brassica rapa subsp. trilocularis TaxID=1813537 RepID=A0ABQ7KM16_BRACM|nr:hypothetical protein IGI04_040160 [Brassica rapa subsp. trilocularis]